MDALALEGKKLLTVLREAQWREPAGAELALLEECFLKLEPLLRARSRGAFGSRISLASRLARFPRVAEHFGAFEAQARELPATPLLESTLARAQREHASLQAYAARVPSLIIPVDELSRSWDEMRPVALLPLLQLLAEARTELMAFAWALQPLAPPAVTADEDALQVVEKLLEELSERLSQNRLRVTLSEQELAALWADVAELETAMLLR